MTLKKRLERITANPSEEIKHYQKMLNDSDTSEHAQAQCRLLVGRCYMLMGHYDLSLTMLQEALEAYLEGNDTEALYYCYTNLGHAYREKNMLSEALNHFDRAHQLSYNLDAFEPVLLSLSNIATVYSALSQFDLAVDYFERALEFSDRLEDVVLLSKLHNNYANVWLLKGDYQKALDYFHKAYEAINSKHQTAYDASSVVILMNIGETHLALDAYDQALFHLKQALLLSEQMDLIGVTQDCHAHLAKTYEKYQDFEKALAHYRAYDDIKVRRQHLKSHEALNQLNIELEAMVKRNEEEIDTLKNVELKNKTLELERTLKNLSTIAAIGQKLTSSMEMDDIFVQLIHSVKALMPMDLFGVALYEKERDIIAFKYFEQFERPLPLIEIKSTEKGSIAAYCIRQDTDVFISDFDAQHRDILGDEHYIRFNFNKGGVMQSIIYCRLQTEVGTMGVMTLQSLLANVYSESDFEVLKALATYVAIAVSNAQKKMIIDEKAKALEFLSYHDSMTGVFNRRYFNQVVLQYAASEASVGLVVGDMNHLKHINDTYGHATGDRYLIQMADTLKASATGHMVFRLGGDEFAVVAVGVTEEDLKTLKASIYEACATCDMKPIPLSIALGCQMVNEQFTDMIAAFNEAESKMYLVKQSLRRE